MQSNTRVAAAAFPSVLIGLLFIVVFSSSYAHALFSHPSIRAQSRTIAADTSLEERWGSGIGEDEMQREPHGQVADIRYPLCVA